jgi:hypothetical protein
MRNYFWLVPLLLSLGASWHLGGKAARYLSPEGKAAQARLAVLGPFAPARYFQGPGRVLFWWTWGIAVLGFALTAVLLFRTAT